VSGYTLKRYKYSRDMQSPWFLDIHGSTWVKNFASKWKTHDLFFVIRQTLVDIEIFKFNKSKMAKSPFLVLWWPIFTYFKAIPEVGLMEI
jgi:hypothetical protein